MVDSRILCLFSALVFVFLATVFAPNCGMENQLQTTGSVVASEPNGLCAAGDIATETSMVFRSCEEFDTDPFALEVAKEAPFTVMLDAVPGMRYCIEVLRKSGYITISHPSGDVDREGNRFTWCVVQEGSAPEHMIIRSFTPSSQVELRFAGR